jgi:hypothetical protein
MSGAIPPLPQYVFMAWCLVKHRGNFTFTFMWNVVVRYNMELRHSFCPSAFLSISFLYTFGTSILRNAVWWISMLMKAVLYSFEFLTTTLQGRHRSQSSLPWKPQILHYLFLFSVNLAFNNIGESTFSCHLLPFQVNYFPFQLKQNGK